MRQARHVAVELDALVICPVGAQLADDRKDQVLRRHARREAAAEFDADALGHPQPRFAGQQQRGGLGAVDAGGEHAQRPVHAGVRIAAHDQHPRPGQPLLDHDLVAHARADVVEMLDAVAADVLADGLVVLGVLFGRGRHDVIEHHDVQVGVGQAELGQVAGDLLDDRRGVVVREQVVGPDGDDLARPDLLPPGLQGQDFSAKVFAMSMSHSSRCRVLRRHRRFSCQFASPNTNRKPC